MRIVAGKWRGRHIDAPAGRDTRPTTDRVREAVFSSVYSAIGSLDGVAALDLFAGSGALGIEALSRGARHCTFVESDRRAARVIETNLTALEAPAGCAEILRVPVERFATTARLDKPAALILADPPYRIDGSEFIQVLEALVGAGAVAPGALVVYEHAATSQVLWPSGFSDMGEKRYGDTAVSLAALEG